MSRLHVRGKPPEDRKGVNPHVAPLLEDPRFKQVGISTFYNFCTSWDRLAWQELPQRVLFVKTMASYGGGEGQGQIKKNSRGMEPFSRTPPEWSLPQMGT